MTLLISPDSDCDHQKFLLLKGEQLANGTGRDVYNSTVYLRILLSAYG
jgi:hypothetical protein